MVSIIEILSNSFSVSLIWMQIYQILKLSQSLIQSFISAFYNYL